MSGFAFRVSRVVQRSHSIRFTHGLRPEIEKDLAKLARTSIHPTTIPQTAASASSTSSSSSDVYELKTVMLGNYPTVIKRLGGEVIGNPFGKPSSLQFDAYAMELIQLGGATPDPPAPPPGDKKKKR